MVELATKEELEKLVIDNEELEKLENLLSEFNIFEALGAVRQELRHSDFLAFLLNPSGNHRMGDYFLKRFLIGVVRQSNEFALSAIDIDSKDFSHVTIERETHHIDILIYDNDFVCVIENKVFSGEHGNQLEEYLKAVKRHFPHPKNKILPIFLSPDGTLPQGENSGYISVSYGYVAETLKKTYQALESTLGTDVKTAIAHYISMLRRHIVSDSTIAELAAKIYANHKAAIDTIIEHIPDIRLEIKNYCSELIEGSAEEFGIEKEQSDKRGIRFVPKKWDEYNIHRNSGWLKTKRIIIFEFDNSKVGKLSLRLFIGKGDDDVRKALYTHAKGNTKFDVKDVKKDMPVWAGIYKKKDLDYENMIGYEGRLSDEIKEKIEEYWEDFLKKDYLELVEHIIQVKFD